MLYVPVNSYGSFMVLCHQHNVIAQLVYAIAYSHVLQSIISHDVAHIHVPNMSRDARKLVFGFSTRSDTNCPVH